MIPGRRGQVGSCPVESHLRKFSTMLLMTVAAKALRMNGLARDANAGIWTKSTFIGVIDSRKASMER
jgi:hypothetical protein